MSIERSMQSSPGQSPDHSWADRFTWIKESSHSEYVVSAGSETTAKIVRACSFDAPEHQHPEAQLSLFRAGTSAFLLTHSVVGRSNRTPVAPGSMAFIPHHQPHRTHWRGDGELLNLYLSPEFMGSVTDSGRSTCPLQPISYRQEAIVNAIAHCLLDEFDRSGEIHPELVDHAKFLIATRLLHLKEASASKGFSGTLSAKRMQPALEVLNERSEDHITLAQLASLCGASVFHFARSFKLRFGSAPFVYQRSVRLQRARNLLRDSDIPIELVGRDVGYQSTSNFSRLFHREVGVSPSAYRRSHQNAKRDRGRRTR